MPSAGTDTPVLLPALCTGQQGFGCAWRGSRCTRRRNERTCAGDRGVHGHVSKVTLFALRFSLFARVMNQQISVMILAKSEKAWSVRLECLFRQFRIPVHARKLDVLARL